MKIEISDFLLTEFFDSLKDGLIKSEMRDIMDDNNEYLHVGDKKYYKKLKKAARLIFQHYAAQDEWE